MDNKLYDLLKEHKIFACLDTPLLHQLVDKFTKIDLKYDDVLFEQGHPSDAIYLLLSGKLSLSVTTQSNQVKVIGYVNAGELIGELTALSHKPHPYTVKALRNSVIYSLPTKDFLALCHQFPACMFEAMQPLLHKTSTMTNFIEKDTLKNIVAIFPIHHKVNMKYFIETLHEIIKDKSEFILFSDYFTDEYSSMNADQINEKINHCLSHIKSNQLIIFISKSSDTPLAKISLKKADKLYFVANALTEPFIDPTLIEHLHKNTFEEKPYPNLIILHPETTQIPRHTSAWLQLTTFNMHHHVRIDTQKHYKRLLRFMRDEANGLTLGGGGTRGWGHLGVLKALCEQDHPIDYIGGTSVGSIIGSCFAMSESYEDTHTKFSKIVSASKNSISWKSLTLPLISVFNAKSFTIANLEVFENIHIEDLWLPFFCVSCNLANSSEEIHKTGLIWEKVRASSSIPGLIPPMVLNSEIHFDGGLLNNLPVDIMWEILGKKAKIIGVELNSSMHDTIKYAYPPIITFKQALSMKMGFHKNHYKYPGFVDIFMRGLLVGSSAKSKQNGLSATIFVNLNLKKFKMLQFSHKQAQKMIEIGFLETISQLHQYANRHF